MQTKTVFWIAYNIESGALEQGSAVCETIGNNDHVWIATDWWSKEFVLQNFTGQELVGEGNRFRVAFGIHYSEATEAIRPILDYFRNDAEARIKKIDDAVEAIKRKGASIYGDCPKTHHSDTLKQGGSKTQTSFLFGD